MLNLLDEINNSILGGDWGIGDPLCFEASALIVTVLRNYRKTGGLVDLHVLKMIVEIGYEMGAHGNCASHRQLRQLIKDKDEEK